MQASANRAEQAVAAANGEPMVEGMTYISGYVGRILLAIRDLLAVWFLGGNSSPRGL
jgi:hypothetical protein